MIKLPLLDPNPCAFACSHLCVSEPQSAICQAEMTWAGRDCCLEAETEGSGHAPVSLPSLAWGGLGKCLLTTGTCFSICKMGLSGGLEAEVQRQEQDFFCVTPPKSAGQKQDLNPRPSDTVSGGVAHQPPVHSAERAWRVRRSPPSTSGPSLSALWLPLTGPGGRDPEED